MGQRTNVIIVTENINGRRNVKVYHDQWGIGRKSYLDLMTISNAVYNLDYDGDICSEIFLPKNVTRAVQIYELEYDGDGCCYQFNDKEDDRLIRDDAPGWIDWFYPEKIGEFIKDYCDNNNGGMVVYIKEWKEEGAYRPDQKIEVKWLLGTEDETREYEYKGKKEISNPENFRMGKAFERWLTAEEYAGLLVNCTYADRDFMAMFKKFCNYFEIKID